MNLLAIYLMISVFVSIIDLARLYHQEEYLNTFPQGDIDYFVEAKTIIGKHNYIFFPSLIIIGVILLIIKLINKVLF